MGFLLGNGIGGSGILWNLVGALFDVVEAAWHMAQQGVAALLIADPADRTSAATAATKAAVAAGKAGQPAAMAAGADRAASEHSSSAGATAMAGADAKEELELAELP